MNRRIRVVEIECPGAVHPSKDGHKLLVVSLEFLILRCEKCGRFMSVDVKDE